MMLQELFSACFPRLEPDGVASCPYRVCPLGAHVDHQHGLVTGIALDRGVTLMYTRCEEPIVELYSRNFEGQIRFTVKREPRRHYDWGDYSRAAMKSLFHHGYNLRYGFSGVIEGTLPIGGLSSSAAVLLTYITVFCRVNDIHLDKAELIRIVLWAEQQFIGLNVGKLDQSCEVYCQKDRLLYLDTASDEYTNISKSIHTPAFRIGVFFSGVPRALVGSAYNARVDECRSAAYALKAYAGIPYERIADTRLRDVPEDVFQTYQDRLPDSWRRRAAHYYSEQQRVRKGVEAWKKGDLNAFGQAIFESGNSSICQYETGSPELRRLHEIMLDTPGVYGGRFSGAGFKGCCMAIVDPSMEEQIRERITREYVNAFPTLRDRFSVHFCDTADGVSI